jgi:micrococcal nuclease
VTILGIILLVVVLLGGVGPWWPYSTGWGYRPFGGVVGLLVLLLIIYLIFGGAARAADCACLLPAQGVRVIDGDTIVVESELLSVGHVRLYGIDAPELAGPCQQERDQAAAAKAKLEQLIKLGTHLQLQGPSRDKYGRVVATVLLGGKDVGQELIAAGLARPYFGGTRQTWC